MTDIVERLRSKFLVASVDDSLDPLLNEAADEIERLRGRLTKIETRTEQLISEEYERLRQQNAELLAALEYAYGILENEISGEELDRIRAAIEKAKGAP